MIIGWVGMNRSRWLLFFPFFVVLFGAAVPSVVRSEDVPSIKIHVESVRVGGNTLIRNDEIQSVIRQYLPYDSEDATLTGLKRFPAAITQLYHKKGYAFAQAYLPEQEIQGGILDVVVQEGALGEVRVKGNRFYPAPFVQKHFDRDRQQGIQNRSLERSMLLLNDRMDLNATGVVDAGSSTGTADLSVQIKDQYPLHVTLDYNNYGAKLVSRHRFGLEVEKGNLFPLTEGDLLSFRWMAGSPVSDLTYGRLLYGIPVNHNGTRVNLVYSKGNFDAGKYQDVRNITMGTESWGVSVEHPFIKREVRTLKGEVGLDGRDFTQRIEPIRHKADQIRLLRVGIEYEQQDTTGRNVAHLSLHQGLGEALGGMNDNDPMSSRSGADDRFFKSSVMLARMHRLTGMLSLLLRGEGQITPDKLVVGEQFSLGGPYSVRGYPSGEYLSDNGYSLTAELQAHPFPGKSFFHLAFFVDTGSGSLKGASVGEVRRASLSGAGFGARVTSFYPYSTQEQIEKEHRLRVDLRADLGFPFKEGPYTHDNSSYLYLQAILRY
jgi:hemolysin activation/secretion protein